jgi:hypothetical protein
MDNTLAGGPRAQPDPTVEGLFSINADGSDERRLSTPGIFVGWGASFSPDGSHIALSILGSLYTMAADGSLLIQRTFDQLSSMPTWSLPGPSLIFEARPTDSQSESRTGIYRLDLSLPGATRVPVTDAQATDGSPDWHAFGGVLPRLLPDLSGPALGLINASPQGPSAIAGVASASRGRRRGPVRRRDLRLVAVDAAGLRSVAAAICRTRRRRDCRRRRWVRVPLSRGLGPRIRRLPPGRYRISLRARDRRGNVSRVGPITVRLR